MNARQESQRHHVTAQIVQVEEAAQHCDHDSEEADLLEGAVAKATSNDVQAPGKRFDDCKQFLGHVATMTRIPSGRPACRFSAVVD